MTVAIARYCYTTMEEEKDLDVQRDFVGRKDFLQNLQTKWNMYRIFGIFGLKSVGKTRTVDEFLKGLRMNHPYPDTVKHLNIDLRFTKTAQAFMLQIKAAFRDDDINEDVDDFIQEVLRKLEESPDLNFILNFDNAEDVIETPEVKDLFVRMCEVLIGKCLRLKIVITSTVIVKFPHVMSRYFWQELPLMSHSDGVALLRSVTPSVQCGSVIDQIVKLCLGLPLAILMTGCELEMDSGYLSPEQMVDILTRGRMEAWGRDCTYSEEEQLGPVYRNFIRRLSDVFRQRLAVLGYIPGSFTTTYAQQMLGARSILSAKDETLSPLMRRHMVEFDPLKRRYNIHGMIKDCLEVYFTIENQTEIRKRYCQIFSNVMRDLSSKIGTRDCVDAVTELATEHPNLQKLMVDIDYSNQETYPIYIQMVHTSSNVIEQYFGGESFQFYTQCLRLCEEYKKPRDVAIVSGAYGRVLTNIKGDLKEGERMYRQALKYAESDLSSREMAAQLYQNLGWNVYVQGRKDEALVSLKKAQQMQNLLGMRLEVLPLTTLSTLGIVNTAIGNFEEGEKYHKESLERRLEKHGESHPHIGSVYNNLGILYNQRGDMEKSNYYYRKGLEIKKATNATPSAIIISISNVASVETMAKNYTAAKELLDEASAMLEKLQNIYTFEGGLTLEGYGRLYLAMGEYSEAIRVLEDTVHLRRRSLAGGVGHVESLLSLGRAHSKAGDTSKALHVFYEALTYKERVAENMPQNRFIWGCLVEMVQILMEERSSRGDNSEELVKLFSYGREELLRIISHYTQKGIFDMRDTYDKKLKEWNEKCKHMESSRSQNGEFEVLYKRDPSS